MKINILEILNIDTKNYGQIIELEGKTYILMGNMVHSLPDKNPCFEIEKQKYKILDNFLITFQNEISHYITWKFKDSSTGGQLWAIKIKIPKKFQSEDIKISLKYHNTAKLHYLLLETNTHFYHVFDFQESEYEIFHNMDSICFSEIQGDQYLTKTGLTLRSFCELKRKNRRPKKVTSKTLLMKLKDERSLAYDYIPHIYDIDYERIVLKFKTKHQLLEKLMGKNYLYSLDQLKFDTAHELVGAFDLIEKKDHDLIYKYAVGYFNFLDFSMYPQHFFYMRGLFLMTKYLSDNLNITLEKAEDYIGVSCRLKKKLDITVTTKEEFQLDYETLVKEETNLILSS